MKNYYQILGLESNATIEEIKAAYKFLAKKFHPDMNPGDPKAKKYFQDIQEAYECLSDVDRRKLSDATYKAWSEGKTGNSNEQQIKEREKEIKKFEVSFKKMQKDYLVWAGLLSTIVGIGLFFTRGETGLGGMVFLIPFLSSGVIYLMLIVYFLPAINAYKNCHEYKKEIFTLNCFSIFTNLLTPLAFIVFYVCMLIYAQNKTKGINVIFMAIIGLFFAGMSAKHERKRNS